MPVCQGIDTMSFTQWDTLPISTISHVMWSYLGLPCSGLLSGPRHHPLYILKVNSPRFPSSSSQGRSTSPVGRQHHGMLFRLVLRFQDQLSTWPDQEPLSDGAGEGSGTRPGGAVRAWAGEQPCRQRQRQHRSVTLTLASRGPTIGSDEVDPVATPHESLGPAFGDKRQKPKAADGTLIGTWANVSLTASSVHLRTDIDVPLLKSESIDYLKVWKSRRGLYRTGHRPEPTLSVRAYHISSESARGQHGARRHAPQSPLAELRAQSSGS